MIEDGARHFDDFDGRVYLNCAAQGPLPRVTSDEIREALGLKTHPNRIADDIYFRLPNRARVAVAPFLGARPEFVTLGAGESHGVHVAALGFPWKPGDRLVVGTSDFPSNYFVWVNAARRAGVEADIVRPTGRAVTTGEIVAAIGDRTRVVTVPWVDFGSGEVIDVERLAGICRERDIFLAVDATQACGVLPLESEALGIGLVTVAGYKWMLAPYGTGFAAVHPAWFERIEPSAVTWTAAEGAENFNTLPREGWDWVATARRFDAPETASFLNVTGLARSAEFLADLGPDAVRGHVLGLLERLEKDLPPGFRRRASGDRIAGPILAVESDDVPRVHRAYERLVAAGMVVSLREDSIRVSPHVWNTERDIDLVLRTLHDS